MAEGYQNIDHIRVVTGTVTIPNGEQTIQYKDIDFSGSIPSGATLVGLQIGDYLLPFVNDSGDVLTWIYNYNKNTRILTIKNKATSWSNMTYSAVFYI